jgi:hypothetical protein
MAKNNSNDFSADILAKSEKHETDIGELTNKIRVLEDKFGTNERIADTLCETAEKATKMQEMIAITFTKVLKTNDDVKKELKTIIDEHDRNKLWWLTGKIAVGIWSVFLVVLTYILTRVYGK